MYMNHIISFYSKVKIRKYIQSIDCLVRQKLSEMTAPTTLLITKFAVELIV